MTDKDLTRKDKILKVTLEIIKAEGFDGVTIRKIATRAEVNIALINYHFGSKENLINEALKILVGVLRESFTILDAEELSPKEKLQRFLTKYFSTAAQYPDIVRRLFLTGNVSFQSQDEFMGFLKTSGLSRLRDILSDLTGINDPAELLTITFQLMGAIAFPILISPLAKNMIGIDIPLIVSAEDYINKLLDSYFGK